MGFTSETKDTFLLDESDIGTSAETGNEVGICGTKVGKGDGNWKKYNLSSRNDGSTSTFM